MADEDAVVIAFPVSWGLEFLPYFKAHVAFMEHANVCERCHMAAFHADDPAAGVDPNDPFCLIGEGLHSTARLEIEIQHKMSLQN